MLVNPRQSSACHARRSPITWAPNAEAPGLQPGDPVVDRRVLVQLESGRQETTLDALRGTGFLLLGFDAETSALQEAARAGAELLGNQVPVTPVQATQSAQHRPTGGGLTTIDDSAGDLRAALGGADGGVAVIRPDGLLLARVGDLGQVRAALERVIRPGWPTHRAFELTGPASPAADPELAAMEDLWRTVGSAIDGMPASERERRLAGLVVSLAVRNGGAEAVRAALSAG